VSDGLTHSWRDPVSDDEMVARVEAQGGRSEAGWWDQVTPRSLGWVSARTADGSIAGISAVGLRPQNDGLQACAFRTRSPD
jgi:hypothetical protein